FRSQGTDDLAELGALAKSPEANIIKLPNISASIPQLKEAIAELQKKGYKLPDYPDEPGNEMERTIKAKYDRIKGSAVNPVLREGNSDRRAPKAVKNYAKKHPHSMGAWSPDSKTHVATMEHGDFKANERSITLSQADDIRIQLVGRDGKTTVLKDKLALLPGEIIDATVLDKKALVEFFAREIADAKKEGLLLSLHLKATMMKVSDPIIFGHALKVYFSDLFKTYGDTFEKLGVDANDGLQSLLAEIQKLPVPQRGEIERDIH